MLSQEDKKEVVGLIQEALKPIKNREGFEQRKENRKETQRLLLRKTRPDHFHFLGGNKDLALTENVQEVGFTLMAIASHAVPLSVGGKRARKATVICRGVGNVSVVDDEKDCTKSVTFQLGFALAVLSNKIVGQGNHAEVLEVILES